MQFNKRETFDFIQNYKQKRQFFFLIAYFHWDAIFKQVRKEERKLEFVSGGHKCNNSKVSSAKMSAYLKITEPLAFRWFQAGIYRFCLYLLLQWNSAAAWHDWLEGQPDSHEVYLERAEKGHPPPFCGQLEPLQPLSLC